LIVLLAASPLIGHDLYLMPQRFHVKPSETLLVSVHNGDAFPVSEGPTDPQRITVAAGAQPLADFRIVGKATHAFANVKSTGTLVFAVQTTPRLIKLDSAPFEKYLKSEGLEYVIAERKRIRESGKPGVERYSKYAKTLVVSGTESLKPAGPLGLPMEIVPHGIPRPGETLSVQVLWKSKPAAGLQVEAAWAGDGKARIVGRTDAAGRIDVPLQHAGKWRIRTVAMERCSGKGADWESYWGSLTFEVP
jgi:hypothetical protein